MKYRSEIDGLRALAVVPVILFHAGFELFSGGFVGVDVFFVVSGYLITTILIEDIENNRFSIINFYERRARRILPALFFLMLICIPVAWMWMLPSQMRDFSQSLVAVSLFASNILFWLKSGYFEASAEEMPLLHTWSLAVEEQYYVLFPVFLIVAWRFGRNRLFWMIVAMAMVSLLLSEWGWRNEVNANFYLFPTRAWELFAGSLAAFIVSKNGVQKNNLLALLGLAAIIFSIFAYDESTPFPSVYALVPVLGVVLIVLYADKETLAAKLLSVQLVVGIGLISYSAYLWHQPLFAFARLRLLEHPSDALMLLLSIFSVALAYLSWRFIEQPFRSRNFFSRKGIFSASLLGLIFFISIGSQGHFVPDLYESGKFHPIHVVKNLSLGSYEFDNKKLQKESWDLLSEMSGNTNYDVEGMPFERQLWFNMKGPKRKILVVGNSHSKDMFNIFAQSNRFLEHSQVARFGVQIKDLGPDHLMWSAPNYLSANHIVIAHRFYTEDLTNLEFVVRRMLSEGKRVSVLKNIFEFPGETSSYNLIDQIISENLGLNPQQMSALINHRYYQFYASAIENRSFELNRELSSITNELNVQLLDRMDYICDNPAKVCFAVQEDLTKNFYDYGHHTLEGSKYFGASRLFDDFLINLVAL